MGFSLSKVFNWMKPKADMPPVPVTPPPPAVLSVPNLYDKKESDILPLLHEQLNSGATLKGSAALHAVCSKGWLESAKLLLDNGAEINAQAGTNISNGTPFMHAAGSGSPELLAELLKRGADAKAIDPHGHNAMYHYIMDRGSYCAPITDPQAQERDRAAFKILLDLGVEMEPVMDHFVYLGRRHLASFLPQVEQALKFEEAIKGKDYETVCKMLADGMKPDTGADFSGDAGLAIAAGQNDVRMVGILIGAGADVKRFSRHFDALHAAASSGSQEAFEKLVGAGAETEGDRYAYDRYEDTTIIEVAGYCKTNPGMKAFAEDVVARKEEVKAEYERTKQKFLHPYDDIRLETDHKLAVHKPLHLRRPASP